MNTLEKWINAILNEDAKNLSIGSVRTLAIIRQRIQELQKQNIEWKEECERLAGLVEFWQKKYSDTQPQSIRGIDNL